MGLCFNVLGSGSSGNSTLVSDGVTNILVDAGLSGKEIARRLNEYGLSPENISAVVVSQDHGDHRRGAAPFVKNLDIPVFMTAAAFEASGIRVKKPQHRVISPGESFEIGDIAVTCFSVPHDAVDPLGFVLEKGGVRIGIAMDLGFISNLVIERLKKCAGIVLESNHDVAMLKAGPYPWALKQRVMSRSGHLSNDAVARYLACDFDGTAKHVVLAHLSRQNNLPDLALISAQKALEERSDMYCLQTKLELAYSDKISKTYCY
jgi:phosphoribosyl 1,2-cyclic phosphodiesterase